MIFKFYNFTAAQPVRQGDGGRAGSQSTVCIRVVWTRTVLEAALRALRRSLDGLLCNRRYAKNNVGCLSKGEI